MATTWIITMSLMYETLRSSQVALLTVLQMTFKRFMSLTAMGLLWTGSQIPLYLWGAIPPYIYRDLGGVDRWVWFVSTSAPK